MMFFCIECGKNLDENRFYRKVKNRCKDCLNKKFKCELCEKSLTKNGSLLILIKNIGTNLILSCWKNQKLRTELISTTTEHYYSDRLFRVKHT